MVHQPVNLEAAVACAHVVVGIVAPQSHVSNNKPPTIAFFASYSQPYPCLTFSSFCFFLLSIHLLFWFLPLGAWFLLHASFRCLLLPLLRPFRKSSLTRSPMLSAGAGGHSFIYVLAHVCANLAHAVQFMTVPLQWTENVLWKLLAPPILGDFWFRTCVALTE